MEEKERNYESPLGVPGGHNLPDEDCIPGDPVNGHDDDRRKDVKLGGQCLTLPRYVKAHSDEKRIENGKNNDSKIASRKVDSLPSNITMLSLEQEKRNKRKGVLKSVGYFFQKLTRRFSLANSTSGLKIKLGQRGSASTTSSNSSNCGNGSIHDYQFNTTGGCRSENSSSGGSNHTLDRSCAGQTQQSSCRLMLEEIPGMIGIHNHGNTCFMNAIIQCLSNTEPLLSYFLSDQYKEDVKRANKHNSKRFGTKGELTEHLANLLKSLWLKKYTPDISTEFRTIVGKYGSQYRGSFQHDVQEFLMWLLDKVHEDLNIATKKKYRANKSSFGRTDEEVAAEAMANHARCNNSFIHDLFQALYRSSLTCPTCQHQSNTFDPFLSVSLPIPRTSQVQPVLATCVSSRQGASSPRCLRVGVVLERGHTVKDLKEELVRNCQFFEGLVLSELLILEVNDKNEFHILDDARLISDPLNNELLYALDISIQSHSQPDEMPANKVLANGPAPLTSSQWDQTRPSSSYRSTDKLETSSNEFRNSMTRPVNGHTVQPITGHSKPIGQDSKANKEVDQCQERVDSAEMSLVIVMNSIRCEANDKKPTIPTLLRLPVATVMNVDQLDSFLRESLNITQKADAQYYLISESGNSGLIRTELNRGVSGMTQAELEEIKRSLDQVATTCIAKDGSTVLVFRILVEWGDLSVKNKSLLLVDDIVENDSVAVATKLQMQANVGTLDECFQVYTQEEMLGEDNDWHCPNCRTLKQGATKSLTLWSLPEILVIHLKRFRQDHEHRSKLNTLIHFPLTGLDLRHHMPQKSVIRDPCDQNGTINPGNWNAAMQMKSSKQQSSWLSWRLGCKTDGSVYDLYAVCNHYGDMQGGHYTAFCRNPVTNTWCFFNDNRSTPIREDEVVTRAAYLLFYRKRLMGQTSMGQTSIDQTLKSQFESGENRVRDCGTDKNDNQGNPHSSDAPPAYFNSDPGRDIKDKEMNPVKFSPCVSKRANREARSSATSGSVTIPLSSVESRPWLVSLLEERRRLHGLSHTITQAESNSHRISRAITSHSLDDLLDGDCDELREDFRGIPVYTTLHPPPRIKKQLAKAPMATISTDSVPMAMVGDSPERSEIASSLGRLSMEKSTFDAMIPSFMRPKADTQDVSSRVSDQSPSLVRPSTSSPKLNGNGSIPPAIRHDESHLDPIEHQQTFKNSSPSVVKQRFCEGID